MLFRQVRLAYATFRTSIGCVRAACLRPLFGNNFFVEVSLISDVSLSTKASVRKELKERVRLFVQVPTLRAAAEAGVVSSLQNLISNLTVSEIAAASGASSVCVSGFNALSDEPDLSSFYHSTSLSLVFPKLTSVDGVMEFTSVANYSSEKWEVSSLGFSHPTSVEVVPAASIQLMLIPGIGFSSSGDRLGRGKGFYDRYLQNFKGLKVGVCFDCQLSEASLPTDGWDIKMDYIITETK